MSDLEHSHGHSHRVTVSALLITLGIIYGDIGTSPLYVMRAIVGGGIINKELILGGLSCIFWTLTIQTTLKYVWLTLQADNQGEGGIFSLYTLVGSQDKHKWLIYPAMFGGALLLADGFITPPISVSSAVEGLQVLDNFKDLNVVPIVIGILTALFFIQQFGTKAVGKFFGPIMFTWFSMLAVLGITNLSNDWSILRALNPYYALNLLINYPDGFWVLGAVFLCTTGAEGIYSDLGHCGKKNIRITWGFVKIALVLNYFGQGAWLLTQEGQHLKTSPFYGIMPEWFLPFGIAVATAAAIVASQALISGSFTLINEAMRLNLWPKVRINYPTEIMGQLYIPSVNLILWIGCMSIVMIFGSSEHMEAAYGLAIITTMMMTTILLVFYLKKNRYPIYFILGLSILLTISEGAFFIANMSKFIKGGYVMIAIAFALSLIMWVMYSVRNIKDEYNEFVNLKDYLQQLGDISKDESLPKYASHLVYLTNGKQDHEVENKIIYSIFQKQPKRADIYWFVHVNTDPTPYKMEYKVNIMKQDDVIRIDFNLGFRVAPRINIFLRKVIHELVANNEVNIISRYPSLRKYNITGDFRFVVLDKFLSNDNEDMPFLRKFVLNLYFFLRKLSLSEEQAFGLDTSQVTVEKVPLIIKQPKDIQLKRVY